MPDSGSFQVTEDTSRYDFEHDEHGIDCPTCDTHVPFLYLVDGHTCDDCGTLLALDVIWAAQRPADSDDDRTR